MADVPFFGIYIMREPIELEDTYTWRLGDPVRAFYPVHPDMWTGPSGPAPGTLQPRKSVLIAHAADLTFAEFAEIQAEFASQVTDADPDDVVLNRAWSYTWTNQGGFDNSDLPPQALNFLETLSDELIVPPYGAWRPWGQILNVAWKNKVTGSRGPQDAAFARLGRGQTGWKSHRVWVAPDS